MASVHGKNKPTLIKETVQMRNVVRFIQEKFPKVKVLGHISDADRLWAVTVDDYWTYKEKRFAMMCKVMRAKYPTLKFYCYTQHQVTAEIILPSHAKAKYANTILLEHKL